MSNVVQLYETPSPPRFSVVKHEDRYYICDSLYKNLQPGHAELLSSESRANAVAACDQLNKRNKI
jgi:hypothetical protein